jgi:transposase-like protein
MRSLQRITGPECPRCGCADSQRIQAFERWGRAHERRRCEHCHHIFNAAIQEEQLEAPPGNDQAAVVYDPVKVRCPKCGTANPPVTSKPRAGVRWHKCGVCGETFKSAEAES